MNRNNILVILAVILICGLLAPVRAGETEKITVVGGFTGIPEKILTARGQSMSHEGTILILNVQDKTTTVKNLIACLQALDTQIEASAHNIYYRNVPGCKRWLISVDNKGNACVKEAEPQKIYVRYDPDNPLAEKEGTYKGYVTTKSIDVPDEITTLTTAMAQYRTIGNIIRALDPSVFFNDPEIMLNTLNTISAIVTPEVLSNLSNTLNIILKNPLK